jgi:hypothetical protein
MTGTLDDPRPPHAPECVPPARHLSVLFECDRPVAGCARYSLEGIDQVHFGRGDAREATRTRENGLSLLELRLPGRRVSSRHARLLRVDGAWALEDLGSKNGTFIQGQRIARAAVAPNDLFEIGHTLLRVGSGAPWSGDIEASPGIMNGPVTMYREFRARLDILARLAPTQVPLLLLGESGTGKELHARWLHLLAGRPGEFVAINCGAIAPNLVEAQLFGHVRGAFSGALRDVRSADGGTLFLDEVADLPPSSQAALLRVLQEREVIPVGSTRPVAVDIRVVAATHAPLEDRVARGDFRRDLYARVAGSIVQLPAVRDRRDDLGLLIAVLLAKIAPGRAESVTLAPEAGRALFAYDWPFNVRELEHCLMAALALAGDGPIERSHLPPSVAAALDPDAVTPDDEFPETEDRKLRAELTGCFIAHRGNVAAVARSMGKARMQIHRWCQRFGIDPDAYRN